VKSGHIRPDLKEKLPFSLLGSRFSVRVQVRRVIRALVPLSNPELRTLNPEANLNTNREARIQK
jgi:hypothetical protein